MFSSLTVMTEPKARRIILTIEKERAILQNVATDEDRYSVSRRHNFRHFLAEADSVMLFHNCS